ncbi:MAG: prephenate dehydrogenase [Candidatus Spyradosoma sp.]
MKIRKLSILGAGLLGASVMQAAKARGVAAECVAWSRSAGTRDACRAADYVDAVFDTPREAVAGADVVVACVPVDRIAPLFAECVPALAPGALLTDVGSVKAAICAETDRLLPPDVAFAGAHPMAGSELSGIAAARADLLEDHLCFIADDARSRRTGARERAKAFWAALGMRTRRVDPAEHDAIVAHVSHLPHAVAAALAAALAEKPLAWRECGAGGLRDTTRVAAGEPHVWRAILEENRMEILPALELFRARLDALHAALRGNDSAALLEILSAASAWRLPLSRKRK